MKVGIVLPQSPSEGGDTWRDVLALARQAEAGGSDSLWVCDHFLYRRRGRPETGYHEPMTLLSALAAVTERVELGSLVLATTFRHPGLLAKMAATVNEIAGRAPHPGSGMRLARAGVPRLRLPLRPPGRAVRGGVLSIVVPADPGGARDLPGHWSRVEDAVILPVPTRLDLPMLDGRRW